MSAFPCLVSLSKPDGNVIALRIDEAPKPAEAQRCNELLDEMFEDVHAKFPNLPRAQFEAAVIAHLVETIAANRIYRQVAEQRGVLPL